jgi:integrase
MYTVTEYLEMLKMAKRSRNTIILYSAVFGYFSKCLDIPVEDLHNHLTPQNLIKYAVSRNKGSSRTSAMHLSILHRYYEINEVPIKPLELNVIKARSYEEADDKPLEFETLKRMMDIADTHGKAILSTAISTGARNSTLAGILLSDLKGDTIRIRPENVKGGRGGYVYLTAEAQEYVDLWLKQRDEYIKRFQKTPWGLIRPDNDQRLFACSPKTIWRVFSNLYQKVDGEEGKYHDKNTIHSCRKYFRTHAVKTMGLDLVEKILGHSGYLTSSYVRISDEDARKMFHEGERVLYITRPEHRTTDREIEIRKEQAAKIQTMEEELQKQRELTALLEMRLNNKK